VTLNNMFYEKPWGLHPAKMQEIHDFVARRLDGTSAIPADVLEKIEAKKSGPTFAEQLYSVSEDGIATIQVFGVIDKRMNMFSDISGGTSSEQIGKAVVSAMNDKKVKGILFDIDSPGGSVSGTKELADLIFAQRGKKPMIAFTDGMMASAAYWIGSAADILVATETAVIGSIGVAMMHQDRSKRDEAMGITRTPIYAGKYKRIASDEKPLSEEGREYLQSMVDDYYAMFISSVAINRNVSEDMALKMADGKDFIGRKAQTAGLVDFIGSRERALVITKERSFRNMDLKTLQENHADLYAQVIAMGVEQGKQEADKAVAEARQTGATAERERITSLLDAGADPQVTREAITDGVTAGEAYKKFFEAEKNKRTTALAGMAASATKPVEPEQPAAVSGDAVKAYEAETSRLMGEGKTRAQAVAAIAASNPGLHEKYLQAINKKGA
jgi:capsid assembly protease